MSFYKAILAFCFVLVVVRKDNRFLVVQEAKHGQGWYLPSNARLFGFEDRTARNKPFAEEEHPHDRIP